MEELLGLILQAVLEIGVECLGYYLLDPPRKHGGRKDDGFVFWVAAFLAAGWLFGVAINAVHPKLLITNPTARVANLMLAPLFSGWLSLQVARARREWDMRIVPGKHFVYGLAFTFAIAATRLCLGQY